MKKSYFEMLVSNYEAEVGEWFAAFKNHYPDLDQHKKLDVLNNLENQTGKALHTLILKYKLNAQNERDLKHAAIKDAQRLGDKSWLELMTLFASDFPAYIPEFTYCLEQAPIEDKPICQQVLEHEIALIEFVNRELNNQADSLTPVEMHIAKYTM